jgi:hypothetical protein
MAKYVPWFSVGGRKSFGKVVTSKQEALKQATKAANAFRLKLTIAQRKEMQRRGVSLQPGYRKLD